MADNKSFSEIYSDYLGDYAALTPITSGYGAYLPGLAEHINPIKVYDSWWRPLDVVEHPFVGIMFLLAGAFGFVINVLSAIGYSLKNLLTGQFRQLFQDIKSHGAYISGDVTRFGVGLLFVFASLFTWSFAPIRMLNTLVRGHGIERLKHDLCSMAKDNGGEIYKELVELTLKKVRENPGYLDEINDDHALLGRLFGCTAGDDMRGCPKAATKFLEVGIRIPKSWAEKPPENFYFSHLCSHLAMLQKTVVSKAKTVGGRVICGDMPLALTLLKVCKDEGSLDDVAKIKIFSDAFNNGFYSVCDWLIKNGGLDVNARDQNQRTLLHHIISYSVDCEKANNVIQWIFDQKPDPTLIGKWAYTALQSAQVRDANSEFTKKLEEYTKEWESERKVDGSTGKSSLATFSQSKALAKEEDILLEKENSTNDANGSTDMNNNNNK